MIRFTYLILVLELFSCNYRAGEKLTDHESSMNSSAIAKMNESPVVISYDTVSPSKLIKDSVQLFFESAFKRDKITVTVDDRKVHSDVISTDHTVGLAKVYRVKKGMIKIRINNLNYIELKHENKNYVRIQFINNKLKIIITDRQPRYK